MKLILLFVAVFLFFCCNGESEENSNIIKNDTDSSNSVVDFDDTNTDVDEQNDSNDTDVNDSDAVDPGEECLEFEDPNLEKCLTDKFSYKCVKRKNRNAYSNVMCIGRGIKSIKGIEQLSSISNLDLGVNEIEDITPLSKLPELFELTLISNKVKSIAPLKNSPRLDYLDISYNKSISFKDLEEGFAELSTIDISNSDIKSIEGLEHLAGNEKLRIISLRRNKIEDAGQLKDFVHLERLYLQENRIRSAEPFRNLNSIKTLYVRENCLQDPSILDEMRERMPDAEIVGHATHQQNGDWCD